MAFVPAPGAAIGSKSFAGAAVSPTRVPRVAGTRMADKASGEGSPALGKAGQSMWKESYFTGGFPGGEAFFQAWSEQGMTGDVPDMPDSMQSSGEYKPKEEKKKGILAKLDATEFFKRFAGVGKDKEEDEVVEEKPAEYAEPPAPVEEGPESTVYDPYFPAKVRNLAPHIDIQSSKSYEKNFVRVSMTEVTASATDVYIPKERKDKAPMIEISYTGSLATSSVRVYLGDVEGQPTLPPPAKPGQAVTTLVPGRGGGLKLNYAIAGQGDVNI